MGAASLLPGACGGKNDIVFVGSSGGADGSGGAEGGQGGMGGAGTGGASTGGGTTGGSGGGNTGGSGGTISATCGNSETEPGEDCDSGGQDAANCDFDCTDAECGDGYTNEEARETCDDDGESAECDDDCTVAECGDGVLNRSAGEQCDDDNEDNGDGCTAECVRELLIIGDGVSEGDAMEILEAAGFPVVLAPVLENEFDGTSPVLDNFCGVIQFDAGYALPMPDDGQQALVDYVDAGGAFMSTGWSAVELDVYGGIDTLGQLLLLDYDTVDVSGTYTVTAEGIDHPVTSELPASFAINSRAESGACKAGSVALLNDGTRDGLCISDGSDERRLMSLGSSFGHAGYRPLQHLEMATLLINSANWLCETDHEPVFPGITPGSTAITGRSGYQAQCAAWQDDVCLQPYIAMASDDIVGPVPHCIDDVISMRPVWGYQLEDTAATWCWIATGRSDVVSSGSAASYFNASGWMYAFEAAEDCVTGQVRHLSTVDVPALGPQVWSFDDFSWPRDGFFMNVACDWAEVP